MINRRLLRPLLVASSLALAGCAAGAAPGATIFGFLSIALALSACSTVKNVERKDAAVDAETVDASATDAPANDANTGDAWVDATTIDGAVDLGLDLGADLSVADAGPDGPYIGPADGGSWDPCCIDNAVSSCFCPSGLACNYGWFINCGDGTCLPPGLYTSEDCGGTWYDGCSPEGEKVRMYCPPGETCEPAVDCGDGLCAPAGTPIEECGGTWENCCVSGNISSCYCPPFAVCNYGLYVDCGEGRCAITSDGCRSTPIPSDPSPSF